MQFSENSLRRFVHLTLQGEALMDALSMAGLEVESRTALEDDHIIEIKLTPNRGDCLSLLGIAREIAALGAGDLIPLDFSEAKVVDSIAAKILHVAPKLCPRYCGRLIQGINPRAQTPQWMKDALKHADIALHSAVVDISNYVLLALGQPMHSFDASQLHGNEIHVRLAQVKEGLKLLDGKDAELRCDDLVIADAEKALALGGIMGGLDCAVTVESSDIFLESAFFPPEVMRHRAGRKGLNTDASYRYERGVDFAITRQALEYATALIQAVCGGDAGAISEFQAQADLPVRPAVQLRLLRVNAVLGLDLNLDTLKNVFQRLAFTFEVSAEQAHTLIITPPSYRFDLNIEEDLIEEVARIHGYEHIPALLPNTTATMLAAPENTHSVHSMGDILVAHGYQEIISLSFSAKPIEMDLLGNSNPVRLQNPMVNGWDVMRSSLWSSLLEALDYNVRRRQPLIMLFEMAKCYSWVSNPEGKPAPAEELHLAGVAYGTLVLKQWLSAERDVSFFDVKADLESVLGVALRYQSAPHPALHEQQSVKVLKDKQELGWLGQLHPRWQEHYALPKPAYLFDLNLSQLQPRALAHFQELPKGWPVRRDLAVLVDAQLLVQNLLDAIAEAGFKQVSQLFVFDVYSGKNLPVGQKSVALSMMISDTEGVLTNEEADVVALQVLAVLQDKCSAVLRI